jgi:hypothetical protein
MEEVARLGVGDHLDFPLSDGVDEPLVVALVLVGVFDGKLAVASSKISLKPM